MLQFHAFVQDTSTINLNLFLATDRKKMLFNKIFIGTKPANWMPDRFESMYLLFGSHGAPGIAYRPPLMRLSLSNSLLIDCYSIDSTLSTSKMLEQCTCKYAASSSSHTGGDYILNHHAFWWETVPTSVIIIKYLHRFYTLPFNSLKLLEWNNFLVLAFVMCI